MKPKQMVLGLAIAACFVLLATSAAIMVNAPELELTGNDDPTLTPTPTATPKPTTPPMTYPPDPTPTEAPYPTEPPIPRLSLNIRAPTAWVGEPITGTVSSTIPNIDVMVMYYLEGTGPIPGEVLGYDGAEPTIQTLQNGDTPNYQTVINPGYNWVMCHIDEDGYGTFTATIDYYFPGVYEFKANYNGIAYSNIDTVTVQSVYIT